MLPGPDVLENLELLQMQDWNLRKPIFCYGLRRAPNLNARTGATRFAPDGIGLQGAYRGMSEDDPKRDADTGVS